MVTLSNAALGHELRTPADYRTTSASLGFSSGPMHDNPIASPVPKETVLPRSLNRRKLVLTAAEHCKSGSCP
jgi:hypothetical protein